MRCPAWLVAAAALAWIAYAPAAEAATTARHLSIEGRVQHVHYRLWARAKALELGLQGWVRNRRDGTVEAVLIGNDRAVEAMIRASRKGPSAAAVTAIRQRRATAADRDLAPSLDDFPILKTAR